MTKQIPKTKKITKKKVNSTKKKNLTIKDKFLKPRTEKQKQEGEKRRTKLTIVMIFILGVLLTFSAYAWFSTSLNVKIKTFNMKVQRNSGLSISFDAINFDYFLDISDEILIDDLPRTYPNQQSQWASNGLIPVSTIGIPHNDTYFYRILGTEGVKYRQRDKKDGFLSTIEESEERPRRFNRFIAFDIFLKNVSGSPVADNLYIQAGTGIVFDEKEGVEISEQMQSLLNSVRIGIVKVGTLPIGTDPTIIQGLQCNNACENIIYEPYSTLHNSLSIEKSQKYGITLEDGREFPTYAYIKAGGPFYVAHTISGYEGLNPEYFRLQQTISEGDLDNPIFKLSDGITKMRVYVWIEGQDIDSLETDSEGAEIAISISLEKDTAGYNAFDIE